MRLKGLRAIIYAERNSLLLCKHPDPIESDRDDLSIEEAEDVCRHDDQLVYLDITPEFAPLGYGEFDEVAGRMAPHHNILIRDDDAAAAGAESCWFSSYGDPDDVAAEYERQGGTASLVEEID